MKQNNNSFKLFITILISCLLLLSFLSHAHSWDGFVLPLSFIFTVFFIVFATILEFIQIIIRTQPRLGYHFRAPPHFLF
jgi:CHASE2 domain-containing sensor protein